MARLRDANFCTASTPMPWHAEGRGPAGPVFALEKPNPCSWRCWSTLRDEQALERGPQRGPPLDFRKQEESHASINANGTGPSCRQPPAGGVKTVFKRNSRLVGASSRATCRASPTCPLATTPPAPPPCSGEGGLCDGPAPRDVERPEYARRPGGGTGRRTDLSSSAWTSRA